MYMSLPVYTGEDVMLQEGDVRGLESDFSTHIYYRIMTKRISLIGD